MRNKKINKKESKSLAPFHIKKKLKPNLNGSENMFLFTDRLQRMCIREHIQYRGKRECIEGKRAAKIKN